MNLLKSFSIPGIILSARILTCMSQEVDYPQVFGRDWEKASEFVAENESWLKPALDRNNLDYETAIAVIFPELIRYSALRDKMEITLLKALYINIGEDYANFSIGHFQIKPSFATEICKDKNLKFIRRRGIYIPDKNDFESDREFRSEIVRSLEDPKSEFSYIVAFLKICERKFDLAEMTVSDKVIFLATAYNYGYNHTFEDINSMVGRKFFSTSLFGSERYSYSDISVYCYNYLVNAEKNR